MNIDEFRAIKAQETANQKDTKDDAKPDEKIKKQEEPKEEREEISKKENEEIKEENKINDNKEEPTTETKIPEKVMIDGIGEVSFDELTKGYLRQSDYTRKAQELAKQNKDAKEALELYNNLKNNPQVVEQLKQIINVPASVDPATSKIMELESRIYDLMLQNEIDKLQNKYPDFEVREVLQTAYDKKIVDLEDAYLLNKSKKTPKQQPVDVEVLKKQLRDELLKEMQSEKDTSSIISTNDQGNPIREVNTPKISPAEENVAKKMFRNVKNPIAEYIKWRDGGQRKKR